MKVLIASNVVGFWRGGHARNILYLASKLYEKGIDVEVYTSRKLDKGVDKLDVPIILAENRNYSLPKFSQSLFDFLKENRYDIVHSNNQVAYKYATLNKTSRSPVIFHARFYNWANAIASLRDRYLLEKPSLIKAVISSFYAFWFDNQMVKNSDFIFANCGDVYRRINKFYSIEKKSEIIHNGVIEDKHRNEKNSSRNILYSVNRNHKIVGYLANAHLLKGWKYLVNIINEVCEKSNNISFLLAGDGPLYNLVQRDLQEHIQNDRVEMLGRISDKKAKSDFFRAIDVFICPAHAPTTVTEALNHERQVLWFSRSKDCANGMDPEEFINTGWVKKFKELDVDEACNKIITWKKNDLSVDDLHDILTREFSWEKIANRVIDAYSSLR